MVYDLAGHGRDAELPAVAAERAHLLSKRSEWSKVAGLVQELNVAMAEAAAGIFGVGSRL